MVENKSLDANQDYQLASAGPDEEIDEIEDNIEAEGHKYHLKAPKSQRQSLSLYVYGIASGI